MKIKYDALLTSALGGSKLAQQNGTSNPEIAEMFRMAWELDALEGRIADGARDMARRFSGYASQVESGTIYDPPTGWSTLREMDQAATKYQALREVFRSLFLPLTGRKLVEVRAEIESAARAVEVAAELFTNYAKVST